MIRKCYIVISMCVYLVSANNTSIFGQDLHHSQFYTSPLNVNPALTGIFNGDIRANANYRSQWFKNNLGNYSTFTASSDFRFLPKTCIAKKGIWNAGLLLNYDKAGDSELSLANLTLGGSYARSLNLHNVVSAGILVGFSQRRFNQDALIWDSQYNGEFADPNIDPGENFENTSQFFIDLGAGINYRWQKSIRTKCDLGVAAFHLNTPEQSFFDQSEASPLPMRLNVHIAPSIKLSSLFDLLIHSQYQQQEKYQELLIGGYIKAYINQSIAKRVSIALGLSSRLSDALIPKIAIEYNNWAGGFSYDINTSDFDVATLGRGGPEFSISYIHSKAHKNCKQKSCPIF